MDDVGLGLGAYHMVDAEGASGVAVVVGLVLGAVVVLAPLADIPVALVEAGLLDEELLAAGTQAASLEIVITVELGVVVDPKKRVGGSFVSTVPLTRELILALGDEGLR